MAQHAKWRFAKPGQGMDAGGDITKAFRGEARALPGFLDELDPGSSARLFTRELIQNAVDARSDHEVDMAARGQSPGARLVLEFEFATVQLSDLGPFAATLDLVALDERTDDVGYEGLGLVEQSYFETGDVTRPIRVLRVHERFTTGMHGPWAFDDARDYPRRMHSALLSLGTTDKIGGAGGSYGYGKAGLATASKIRTVAAYTCFVARPEETDDVTRRLLGVAYWAEHRFHDRKFIGYGTLGSESEAPDLSEPLSNEAADAVAVAVGFPIRNPNIAGDLGTSYLVLDPDFGPEELRGALELFWWPALESHRFEVAITDNDAPTTSFHPRPRKVPGFEPFWRTFEWVRGVAPAPESEYAASGEFKRLQVGGAPCPVGRIGLLVDEHQSPTSWSWSDSSAKSIVALIRGTEMVVSYLEVDTGLPQARGVFLADKAADPFLRQAEPKAHDDWQHRRDSGIPEDARLMAAAVKERVRRWVVDLTRPLRPKPSLESVFLDEFSRFFKGPTGTRPTRGEATSDPWRIEVATSLVDPLPTDPELLQLQAHIEVGLGENAESAALLARVAIRFGALEDADTFNTDGLACHVTPPPEWEREESEADAVVFVGVLTRDPAAFLGTSCTFQADWTGAFQVSVEPVGQPLAGKDEMGEGDRAD
jgi:hypothetical protein